MMACPGKHDPVNKMLHVSIDFKQGHCHCCIGHCQASVYTEKSKTLFNPHYGPGKTTQSLIDDTKGSCFSHTRMQNADTWILSLAGMGNVMITINAGEAFAACWDSFFFHPSFFENETTTATHTHTGFTFYFVHHCVSDTMLNR